MAGTALCLLTLLLLLLTTPAAAQAPLEISFWYGVGGQLEKVIQEAAEMSRPVYVFTPNRPPELQVALTLGADAVITDHVAIAVELRRRLLRFPLT